MDRRANDPQLLLTDPLFQMGDLGVASESTAGTSGAGIRSLSAGNELRQVWPSPGLAGNQRIAVHNVISTASQYFGTPYEYGSNRDDPTTFDCSDFTRWSYLYTLGMDLPKDSRKQADYVRKFSARKYADFHRAQPGDLLFFSQYNGWRPEDYNGAAKNGPISHVGIYIGNGKMIHTASARTGGVRIDPIAGTHFEWRFVMGGSVLETNS